MASVRKNKQNKKYVIDEVGGYHSGGKGWNPYGVSCGECNYSSCAGCPSKDITLEERLAEMSNMGFRLFERLETVNEF